MVKRKSISKKIRFEVFKRDKFTCQYCGRKAPDVILEVDHIKPVADGGGNDIMNLITSCFDCNRGKGKRKLDDKTVVQKQQAQLEELAARNEQLEMMLNWKNELLNLQEKEVDAVASVFVKLTDYKPSDSGICKIRKWLKSYSVDELMNASEIAISAFYKGDERSWNIAFNKVVPICRNRKKLAILTDEQMRYFNYFRKIARAEFDDWDSKYEEELIKFVKKFCTTTDEFFLIREDYLSYESYEEFRLTYCLPECLGDDWVEVG